MGYLSQVQQGDGSAICSGDFAMSFASNARRRSLVFLTAGALVAGLGVVVTSTAAAVEPCASKVTNLTLDSTQRFASGGRLKRYDATVNYPDGSPGTWRDQRAKILLAKYPSTAYPTLLNANIGIQIKTGAMVKAQEPPGRRSRQRRFLRDPDDSWEDLQDFPRSHGQEWPNHPGRPWVAASGRR